MDRVEKNPRPARSRPVSCKFCRSRKLRCSRRFPCPNCTGRGITCDLDESTAASISEATEESPPASWNAFQGDVLSRLRRLEERVIGPYELDNAPSAQNGSQPSQPPSRKGDFFSGEEYNPIDLTWLEGEITYPNSVASLVPYELEFKTCSIKSAAFSALVVCKTSPGKIPTRTIWLPRYDQATQIVEKYLTDITYIHHVVHIPSVRAMVEELYQSLNSQTPIKIGQVNLLLAILSSTTFFWTERDMDKQLFSSVEEANAQFTMWIKLALEVIEYSRRTRSDSLEDIQAMIIVGFAICNVVGITSQTRYLFSTANSVAWHLALHRIDHPNNAQITALADLSPGSVRAEIGRRVWWYLVATDWQLSQFASPQRGTYAINPHHMATKKPHNANDEDLVDRKEIVGKRIDEPTSMSYYLQRIKLGEICRGICDSTPFAETVSETPQYQRMRDVDTKLRDLAQTLPPFFSLDFNSSELPDADPRKAPGIIIQRYIINSLLHAQRCRLHLPYLSRAATEPVYAYSREACMEAARMVIRTERQLAKEDIPFVLARLKFLGMLHCVFVAITVLLMDLCRNKSPDSEDGRESRVEIYDAFSILEEARGQSPFVEKVLESFYMTLRKHNIPLSGSEGRPVSRQSNDGEQPVKQAISSVAMPTSTTAAGTEGVLPDPSLPSFDDLWQTFDTNMDSSTLVDWNSLFSELDSPFSSL